MLTIKKIKDLDFNTIQEYFEYIADSIVNGQRSQAKELIKDLSKQQRRAALNYFEFQIEQGELLDELRKKLGAVKIEHGYLIK